MCWGGGRITAPKRPYGLHRDSVKSLHQFLVYVAYLLCDIVLHNHSVNGILNLFFHFATIRVCSRCFTITHDLYDGSALAIWHF